MIGFIVTLIVALILTGLTLWFGNTPGQIAPNPLYIALLIVASLSWAVVAFVSILQIGMWINP